MATVRKIFSSWEFEDFNKFLQRHMVTMEATLDPDGGIVFFHFRKTVYRITERTEWKWFGMESYRVPVQEPEEIQCSIMFTIHQLYGRPIEDLLEELRCFVTEQFRLNEDTFKLDTCDYTH